MQEAGNTALYAHRTASASPSPNLLPKMTLPTLPTDFLSLDQDVSKLSPREFHERVRNDLLKAQAFFPDDVVEGLK